MSIIRGILHHLTPWLLRGIISVAFNFQGSTRTTQFVTHFLEEPLKWGFVKFFQPGAQLIAYIMVAPKKNKQKNKFFREIDLKLYFSFSKKQLTIFQLLKLVLQHTQYYYHLLLIHNTNRKFSFWFQPNLQLLTKTFCCCCLHTAPNFDSTKCKYFIFLLENTP